MQFFVHFLKSGEQAVPEWMPRHAWLFDVEGLSVIWTDEHIFVSNDAACPPVPARELPALPGVSEGRPVRGAGPAAAMADTITATIQDVPVPWPAQSIAGE